MGWLDELVRLVTSVGDDDAPPPSSPPRRQDLPVAPPASRGPAVDATDSVDVSGPAIQAAPDRRLPERQPVQFIRGQDGEPAFFFTSRGDGQVERFVPENTPGFVDIRAGDRLILEQPPPVDLNTRESGTQSVTVPPREMRAIDLLARMEENAPTGAVRATEPFSARHVEQTTNPELQSTLMKQLMSVPQQPPPPADTEEEGRRMMDTMLAIAQKRAQSAS